VTSRLTVASIAARRSVKTRKIAAAARMARFIAVCKGGASDAIAILIRWEYGLRVKLLKERDLLYL